MKLEFLDDLSDGGKFKPNIAQLVMLFDFDTNQARILKETIEQTILVDKKPLSLRNLSFVEAINCDVVLRVAVEDKGLSAFDNKLLFCDLSIAGFEYMVNIIEGFCQDDSRGHNWLYDTWENPNLSEIEFLISPEGTW